MAPSDVTGRAPEPGSKPRLVCPQCRRELRAEAASWTCSSCVLRFPVLHGIADLRLRGDRYLSIEEERAKARRLHDFGREVSFERLLEHYYEITDDVPPEMAVRYRAYVVNGPAQGEALLDALAPSASTDSLLDVGCGAGGLLLAAAGRCRSVVGVDVALRWLVICRKRLEERGVDPLLVCADAESLPFEDETFTHVTAGDLVEHVADARATLSEMHRVLAPGGRAWLSAANRYSLGPHPSTRLIGIGYLPRRVRTALVVRRRGIDLLRFVRLVSPLGMRRLVREAGLRPESLAPRRIRISPQAAYPLTDRVLISAYRLLVRIAPLRIALVLFGPSFEILARKPASRG